MTKKAYLDDSYTTRFQARVLQSRPVGDTYEIHLEETWFYPESGGQPADSGWLGGARVRDVQQRDGEIVHILDGEVPTGEAAAEIDWNRRYDHMQQHTAQHLLTAALARLFDAATLSFHLGSETCTIDIDAASLSLEQLRAAEDQCCQWIALALPVKVEYIDAGDFRKRELRKKALPDHIDGPVRLIHIGDVDSAHCGGTHVRTTAELLFIHVAGTEKVRDTLRIHFVAGQRAVQRMREHSDTLDRMAASMTCGLEELPDNLEKLQRDAVSARNQLKKLSRELARFRAAEIVQSATTAGGYRFAARTFEDMNGSELKELAGAATSEDAKLVFFGIGVDGDRAHAVLASGDAVPLDMGQLLRRILPVMDGKGGGRGNHAQGAGDADKAEACLQKAESDIAKQLEMAE